MGESWGRCRCASRTLQLQAMLDRCAKPRLGVSSHSVPQIWSMSNLFSAPWSKQRPADEMAELAYSYGASAVSSASVGPPGLSSGPSSWLYFNLLVTQSQIFLPVYDVAEAQEMARQLWSGGDGGEGGGVFGGMFFPPGAPPPPPQQQQNQQQPRSGFERVADMVLAHAVLNEVDETGECKSKGERSCLAASGKCRPVPPCPHLPA